MVHNTATISKGNREVNEGLTGVDFFMIEVDLK